MNVGKPITEVQKQLIFAYEIKNRIILDQVSIHNYLKYKIVIIFCLIRYHYYTDNICMSLK